MDWNVFDALAAARGSGSKKPLWAPVDALCSAARKELDRALFEREGLVRSWDEVLTQLGGDPCRHDWDSFRPLRLSREEDWSDWLAFLLERSRHGTFAEALFGSDVALGALGSPSVAREERTIDGARRADLIVRWAGGGVTHVEVKIGDENFDKTFATAERLADENPRARPWNNFMLLPPVSLAAWLECKNGHSEAEPEFQELTWTDVAVALRSALRGGGEDLGWTAWAYAFDGAVEQLLLGHPTTPRADSRAATGLAQLPGLASQIETMRRAFDVTQEG
jgi:hypothetical protein